MVNPPQKQKKTMDPVIEDGDSDFSAETEFRGGGDEGICSPRGRCIRYLALFFMCFLGFGMFSL